MAEEATAWTIEISTPTCNSVLWPLPRLLLRGAWRKDRLKNLTATDNAFGEMPDIPGIFIRMQAAVKRVIVYDPLALPRNVAQKELIFKVYKRTFAKESRPVDAIKYDDLGESMLKEWNYWARRFLDCQSVQLRDGRIPEMAEIMGNKNPMTANHFDTGHEVERRRVSHPYMKPIPVDYMPPPIETLLPEEMT